MIQRGTPAVHYRPISLSAGLVHISHDDSSRWNGNHRQSRGICAFGSAGVPPEILRHITKSRRDAGATKLGLRLAFVWGLAGWGNLCEKCGLAGIVFPFAREELSVFQIPESRGISMWIERDGVEGTMVCAPSQTRASGIRTRLPGGRGDRKRCARPGRDEIRAGFSWN